MSRRTIRIVAAAVIGAVVMVVAIFLLVTNLTQPLVDVGDQFMKAIQNHDMDTAYALFATELRDEVGQETFADIFAAAAVTNWSYASRVIRNGGGYLSGQATIDNQTYQFELRFIDRDGRWQLTAYNFNQ